MGLQSRSHTVGYVKKARWGTAMNKFNKIYKLYTSDLSLSRSFTGQKNLHKPQHKPKTYTQQLQELQRPATVKRAPLRNITRMKRAHPYQLKPVRGSWDLEEEAKKILYSNGSNHFVSNLYVV